MRHKIQPTAQNTKVYPKLSRLSRQRNQQQQQQQQQQTLIKKQQKQLWRQNSIE
jgi:hypothetical protein